MSLHVLHNKFVFVFFSIYAYCKRYICCCFACDSSHKLIQRRCTMKYPWLDERCVFLNLAKGHVKARGCMPQPVSGQVHICLGSISQLKSSVWSGMYLKPKCENDLCYHKIIFQLFDTYLVPSHDLDLQSTQMPSSLSVTSLPRKKMASHYLLFPLSMLTFKQKITLVFSRN